MQKITPFLWFDTQAEEAMNFYVSVFKNAKAGSITRSGPAAPGEKGKVIMATFQVEGQEFMALNGGPHAKFTEAISFYVDCSSQEEVDELWENLSAGGQKSRCGWLKDKFGISWQVIPRILGELMQSKDPQTAQKVMQAMLAMDKIDIKKLQEAAARS